MQPRGFTLTEALVAMTMFALLLAVAAPSFAVWLAEIRLRNAAHALADAIALARSEAIKHSGRATLCKSLDRQRCTTTGGWESGWLLFLDENRNATREADEPIVRIEPAAERGITARANQPLANYVSFTALGHARLVSGALQMGTFVVCRPGSRAYNVVLANTGRVRVDRSASVCP